MKKGQGLIEGGSQPDLCGLQERIWGGNGAGGDTNLLEGGERKLSSGQVKNWARRNYNWGVSLLGVIVGDQYTVTRRISHNNKGRGENPSPGCLEGEKRKKIPWTHTHRGKFINLQCGTKFQHSMTVTWRKNKGRVFVNPPRRIPRCSRTEKRKRDKHRQKLGAKWESKSYWTGQ